MTIEHTLPAWVLTLYIGSAVLDFLISKIREAIS